MDRIMWKPEDIFVEFVLSVNCMWVLSTGLRVTRLWGKRLYPMLSHLTGPESLHNHSFLSWTICVLWSQFSLH